MEHDARTQCDEGIVSKFEVERDDRGFAHRRSGLLVESVNSFPEISSVRGAKSTEWSERQYFFCLSAALWPVVVLTVKGWDSIRSPIRRSGEATTIDPPLVRSFSANHDA